MANKTNRIEFLESPFADSNEFCRTHNMSNPDDKAEYEQTFDLSYWADKIADMADASDLGRSAQWKHACGWARWQVEDDEPTLTLYRWAAFQGAVYMGHAI